MYGHFQPAHPQLSPNTEYAPETDRGRATPTASAGLRSLGSSPPTGSAANGNYIHGAPLTPPWQLQQAFQRAQWAVPSGLPMRYQAQPFDPVFHYQVTQESYSTPAPMETFRHPTTPAPHSVPSSSRMGPPASPSLPRTPRVLKSSSGLLCPSSTLASYRTFLREQEQEHLRQPTGIPSTRDFRQEYDELMTTIRLRAKASEEDIASFIEQLDRQLTSVQASKTGSTAELPPGRGDPQSNLEGLIALRMAAARTISRCSAQLRSLDSLS